MLHMRAAGHDHHDDEGLVAALECGPDDMASYGLGLHIAAIFIMMAVSIAGFCVPHLIAHGSRTHQRAKHFVIELGKAFGTGVVISTGFIHMLMEAAHEFSNECAPSIFHKYEAWAFAICIFTIFCVQALEFFMTRSLLPSTYNGHSHSAHDVDEEAHNVAALITNAHNHDFHDVGSSSNVAKLNSSYSGEAIPPYDTDSLNIDGINGVTLHSPLSRPETPCAPTRDCTPACVDNVAVMVMPADAVMSNKEHCATLIAEPNTCENQEVSVDEIQRIKYVHVDPVMLGLEKKDTKTDDKTSMPSKRHGHGHVHGHIHIHRHDPVQANRAHKLRKRVAIMVLEAGIAIHSILIGLTLGVQPDGNNFTSLLIALSFHQFFEGWALAEATRDAQYRSMKPIIATGIFYSLTTPVGVAIGVGIHDTYNANSTTSITLLGVLDSICAGILIYMGIVQFMTTWFTSNEEFMRKPLWYILCVYMALLGGLTAMASIGIWA